MNNILHRWLGFASPLLILILWFLLTTGGVIKPLYLPSPIAVFQAAIGLRDSIMTHVLSTFLRVLLGFSFGAVGGVVLGIIMSYNRYVHAILHPVVESWRPVPAVALVPFFILWFGFSLLGRVLLVSLGCGLILVVNTIEAVRQVPPHYIRAAYSLGADQRSLFRTVIIPAILPQLKAGLRIGLAISISLVVVSEFLGAQQGIGYLLNISKVTFSTQTIMLGIFILGFMSWVLDALLQKSMNRITHWSEKAAEAMDYDAAYPAWRIN